MIGLLLFLASASAGGQSPEPRHASVRLVASGPWLALEVSPQPGWHIYWKNPGDAGSPPTVAWRLPPGVHVDSLRFPVPRRIPVPPLTAFGYEERTLFPSRLTGAPATATRVRADVAYVVCRIECVAERDSIDVSWGAIARDEAAMERALASLPLPASRSTMARLSGDSANVAITITGVAREASAVDFLPGEAAIVDHGAPVRVTRHRDTLVLNVARSRYLAKPPATLSGLLVLSERGQPRAYEIVARASPVSQPPTAFVSILLLAFLGGILTNLMPCVFPVLGIKVLTLMQSAATRRSAMFHAAASAAGSTATSIALGATLILVPAAATAPWGAQMQSRAFVIFSALVLVVVALGLFDAYSIPALWPRAFARLEERAGAYPGSFLSGCAAVLIGAPCTAPLLGAALAGALLLRIGEALAVFAVFGIGLSAPFVMLTISPGMRALLPRSGPWLLRVKRVTAIPVLATAAWLLVVAGTTAVPASTADRLTFSTATLESLRSDKRIVFVDFTAAWCLTCRVNDLAALRAASVDSAFRARNVAFVVADLTRQNPDAERALSAFGRRSVPAYALFAPGDSLPRLLPLLLTPGTIVSALDAIPPSKIAQH